MLCMHDNCLTKCAHVWTIPHTNMGVASVTSPIGFHTMELTILCNQPQRPSMLAPQHWGQTLNGCIDPGYGQNSFVFNPLCRKVNQDRKIQTMKMNQPLEILTEQRKQLLWEINPNSSRSLQMVAVHSASNHREPAWGGLRNYMQASFLSS